MKMSLNEEIAKIRIILTWFLVVVYFTLIVGTFLLMSVYLDVIYHNVLSPVVAGIFGTVFLLEFILGIAMIITYLTFTKKMHKRKEPHES